MLFECLYMSAEFSPGLIRPFLLCGQCIDLFAACAPHVIDFTGNFLALFFSITFVCANSAADYFELRARLKLAHPFLIFFFARARTIWQLSGN